MSEDRINRLRAGLENFNRTGEIDPSFLTDDFELHQAPSIIDTAGIFRGTNATRQSMSELNESFEDMSFEAERFLDTPGGEVVVFIRARGRGRGSGVQIDNRIAWVFTFRGNLLARLVIYEDRDEALEALGLSA